MTAPQTDVEKQAKRHRGPLVGIVLVLIVALAAAFFFAGTDEVAQDDAVSIPAPVGTDG